MAPLGTDRLNRIPAHKIIRVVVLSIIIYGVTAASFSRLLISCSKNAAYAEGEDAMHYQRKKMVEQQIQKRGITDEKVIAAMLNVKRHIFVPENVRHQSYEDYPLPIGQGQTISQPYIVAYMTEVVALKKEDKVLEIGTGSGYQAAVLAEIVDKVYTIEIIKELAEQAKYTLKEAGYTNIYIRHGDGFKGWPQEAPFDVIIVTAAPGEIPPKLIEQLKVGGKMVIPVGSFFQDLYLITKRKEGFDKKTLLPVRFVPMVPGIRD